MSGDHQGRSLLRNPFFWAAVGAAVSIPAYRLILGPAKRPIPVLGQIPNVTLTDQDGRSLETASLDRGPWIANFFFTSCATVCPPMMRQLADIQGKLAEEELPVRIVSITVDPANDLPSVLKAYGTRLGADFSRWSFVTGEPETIASLAREGFKVHVGLANLPNEHAAHTAHAARWMLVDETGALRGTFAATPQGADAVLRRARVLSSAR